MASTDERHDEVRARPVVGIGLALTSSASFALSGVLARAMVDSGWSAGATVTVRVAVGAAMLVIPGLLALRGQWASLRESWAVVVLYGVVAVAGCQLAFFYAVTYLQVGVALLIEYASPLAVLVWLWLRHHQRPSRLTVLGAALAIAGLFLVLDVRGNISGVGVAWALAAMVGGATYFVISADERGRVPPLTLAASGLVVGAIPLSIAGAVGALPMAAGTQTWLSRTSGCHRGCRSSCSAW